MINGIITFMSSQDVLGVLIVATLITIASCAVIITIHLVKAITSFTDLVDGLHSRTLATLPSLVISLIGKLIKRRR